jgi:uncharacterized protein YdaT
MMCNLIFYTMPWDENNYPDSFKNFTKEVRNKAIAIANRLLEEKSMPEGIAIATAISRAKDWAANRNKKIKERPSRETDVKSHGQDQYVVPLEKGWGVKTEKEKQPYKKFDRKPAAVKHAREKAKAQKGSLTIQRKDGRVQDRISYNPNKKA